MTFVTHRINVSYRLHVSNCWYTNNISQIHQSLPSNRKLKETSPYYITVTLCQHTDLTLRNITVYFVKLFCGTKYQNHKVLVASLAFIAPASQVLTSAMFLLLSVGNSETRHRGTLQWHSDYITFHENRWEFSNLKLDIYKAPLFHRPVFFFRNETQKLPKYFRHKNMGKTACLSNESLLHWDIVQCKGTVIAKACKLTWVQDLEMLV